MKRRDFLKSTGALVVSFSMRDLVFAQGPPQPGRFDGPGTPRLDSWIAIGADGNVTAYTGKVELGHGLYTSQTQLVAEELCVPLSRVKLIQGDTDVAPDQGTTSGSQSHPVNFNNGALALAAATAREALVQMAAQRMGVAAALLRVDEGVISGAGRAGLSYARTHRRQEIQPHAQSEREAQARQRVDDPRHVGRRVSTSRRSRPGSSSSSTTSASPACCTAASSVRRKSARRSCAWTSRRSTRCRAS